MKDTLLHHLEGRSDDVQALALLAQAYAKLQQSAEAISTIQRALTVAPNFAQGWNFLANLQQQVGDQIGAINALTRYIELQPGDVFAFGSLIHLLWEAGRSQEASALLERASQRQAISEWKRQITALLKERRYDEAERLTRQSLAIDGNDAELWCQLGSALTHTKRYGEAEDAYGRALALQPNLLPALRTKAALCTQRKDLQEAGTLLQRALKVAPEDPDLLAQFGADILAPVKMYAQAEECFQKALSLRPGFTQVLINLAEIFIDQGRYAAAAPYAQEAKQTLSDQTLLAHCKASGTALARCELIDDAKDVFHLCLRRDPSDALGVRLLLAQHDNSALPDRAPDALLDELYTARAQYWGVGSQCYRGASLVADALEQLVADRADLTVLDAGCGNGLVGERVRRRAGRLTGVDLSQAMLDKVPPGIYDELQQGDLVIHMEQHPAAYDAITCAATLIHFGDLRLAFQAAFGSLRDHGVFVLTLFPKDDDDAAGYGAAPMELASSGCYAHSERYVRLVAEETGFEVVVLRREIHEVNRVNEQWGLVVGLRRPKRA